MTRSRYVDEGQEVVFLLHNDQNLVVRVGDTIAQQYKVESLNGNKLMFKVGEQFSTVLRLNSQAPCAVCHCWRGSIHNCCRWSTSQKGTSSSRGAAA